MEQQTRREIIRQARATQRALEALGTEEESGPRGNLAHRRGGGEARVTEAATALSETVHELGGVGSFLSVAEMGEAGQIHAANDALGRLIEAVEAFEGEAGGA